MKKILITFLIIIVGIIVANFPSIIEIFFSENKVVGSIFSNQTIFTTLGGAFILFMCSILWKKEEIEKTINRILHPKNKKPDEEKEEHTLEKAAKHLELEKKREREEKIIELCKKGGAPLSLISRNIGMTTRSTEILLQKLILENKIKKVKEKSGKRNRREVRYYVSI